MSDQTFFYVWMFCLINRVFIRQQRVELDIKDVLFKGVKPDMFYVWFPG